MSHHSGASSTADAESIAAAVPATKRVKTTVTPARYEWVLCRGERVIKTIGREAAFNLAPLEAAVRTQFWSLDKEKAAEFTAAWAWTHPLAKGGGCLIMRNAVESFWFHHDDALMKRARLCRKNGRV